MPISARFAIIHQSGALQGLGATEDAAWADAQHEADAAGFDLLRHEYTCRKAPRGLAYSGLNRGGMVVAQLVLA